MTLNERVAKANEWATILNNAEEIDEALHWAWERLVDDITAEMGMDWVVDNLVCVEG